MRPTIVVTARLCGGVAISLKEVLSVGDHLDGCLRVHRIGENASFVSEFAGNEDGISQVSLGGSVLAIEIAVPACSSDV